MSWILDNPIDIVEYPNKSLESKPKLSKKEIEKAVEVFKSFVDPNCQGTLFWTIKNKFHNDTFIEFWRLASEYNKNPIDHPYSVDQYIIDKGLALAIREPICNNADCGNCGCD